LIGLLCIFFDQVVKSIAFIVFAYLISQILFGIIIIHCDIEPHTLFVLTLISIYVIFGILVYFLKGLLQILTTSTIGSYSIIRGFGFIIGNFPEEGYISTLIRYREIYQLKRIILHECIFYSIASILILMISIIIQFNTYKEDETKDDKRRR